MLAAATICLVFPNIWGDVSGLSLTAVLYLFFLKKKAA